MTKIGDRPLWIRLGIVTASVCVVAREIRAEDDPGAALSGVGCLLLAVMLVGGAVAFLRGFDRIAGRGPKQVSDGIRSAGVTRGGSVAGDGVPGFVREWREAKRRQGNARPMSDASIQEMLDRAKGVPEPPRIPCPMCAEMILPGAKKCRFCGEFLAGKN